MSAMVGFTKIGNNVIEFLPESEQLLSKNERRVLFFNLYNYYVDKNIKIDKKAMLIKSLLSLII